MAEHWHTKYNGRLPRRLRIREGLGMNPLEPSYRINGEQHGPIVGNRPKKLAPQFNCGTHNLDVSDIPGA
jgi:hypothetical protein